MKISIITPNYNYSQFLPALLDSIVGQNYKNWEHIIVDDGSTDNSVEIIKSYVEKYPNKIKLITQKNQGQTLAINRGLREVSGDIIAWINSDDCYCVNVFNTIIESFLLTPKIDAVFGDIEIIDKNDKKIKINKYLNFSYASGVFIGFGKTISSNAIFWKKQLTDKTGLFDEKYEYAMDSEYWSRLLWKKKIKKINIPIAKFRWHVQAKTILRKEKNSKANLDALREDQNVFMNSYKNLTIAKIIPIKFTFILKKIFKAKRILYRFIAGHYF